MKTPQVLDIISKKLINSGKDPRYHVDAYLFVMRGIDFYHTKAGEVRHYTGEELAKGLLEFSSKQYGPLARDVLEKWGIKKTDDLGNIIYNLIILGLIKKTEEDSVYDFYNIISFNDFFKKRKYHKIDKDHIKSIKDS